MYIYKSKIDFLTNKKAPIIPTRALESINYKENINHGIDNIYISLALSYANKNPKKK